MFFPVSSDFNFNIKVKHKHKHKRYVAKYNQPISK